MKALDRRGKGENLATKWLSTKIGVLAFWLPFFNEDKVYIAWKHSSSVGRLQGAMIFERSSNWPSSDTMWDLILSSKKKITSGIVKEDAEMLCIHRRKAVKIPHNAILIVTWTCPTSCLPFYVFIICCMIIAYTTDRTSSTRLCQGYNAYSTAKSKGTSTKCISLSKGGVWFRWNKWDCWLSAASLRWVKKPWIRLRLIENGRTIFDWASPAPYSAP